MLTLVLMNSLDLYVKEGSSGHINACDILHSKTLSDPSSAMSLDSKVHLKITRFTVNCLEDTYTDAYT